MATGFYALESISVAWPGTEALALCAGAKEAFEADLEISSATDAVFGHLRKGPDHTDCVRPYRLLRYGDADVLLTLKADPGLDICHGCGGDISAFVLRRTPEQSKVVARFPLVGAYGTFGDPGQISPIQFNGHDAFVMVYGGTFQGFTSRKLSIFVFRGGRLVALHPDLPFDANDAGAKEDAATDVDASWRVAEDGPGVITIDYLVKNRTDARRSSASWKIVGDMLVPLSGAPPAEWAKAGGRE